MKTEIDKYNPCEEAVVFRKKYKHFKNAWRYCHRGDWMLWLAFKVGVNKRTLTLAKGLCAKTVIHLMKDQRSKDAVKAAIDYGEGKINDNKLNADAYASAAYASAASAAYASAYASYAAYASDAAASASDAAASAAYDAYAAKINNQKLTADICREILTEEILKRL